MHLSQDPIELSATDGLHSVTGANPSEPAAAQALEHARAEDHAWRERHRAEVQTALRRMEGLQMLVPGLGGGLMVALFGPLLQLVRETELGLPADSPWWLPLWLLRYVGVFVLMLILYIRVTRPVTRYLQRRERELKEELAGGDAAQSSST